MNELQARELETFEQDDRFQVTDLNSANWVLKVRRNYNKRE